MSKTQENLSENPSFRCTESELEEARKEARRRGMTFSQLVRLLVRLGVAQGTGRIQ